MIFLSHQAWSSLRPTFKQGGVVFTYALIIVTLILPITKIYAANDTTELSKLLKSELGLEVSEDKLSNLPLSKQAEIINLLLMIERGRTLFSGKTPAENALGVLAQLVEGEVDKGVWDTVLDSLFKLSQTPIEKVKDIADKSTKVFLSVATIYALPSVPREMLVLDYIQNYRLKGLNDEQAWKKMSDNYKSIGEIGHCNYNATISGDGNCERAIALKRGGESLRSYAQLTYESFNLAQRLSSNPQQKEALKQWVLSEVEKAQKLSQPSFLSRITTAIATTIVKAADVVQTFVTNAAQTITNSLKTASTSVKGFFTGTTSPKETEIKSSDLSGQISNAIPDKQVATKPTNPNPFQALYDLLERGGKLQSCVKNKLGDKFTAAYNGKYVSPEMETGWRECARNVAGQFTEDAAYIVEMPTLRQCIQNATGSTIDLSRVLADPASMAKLEKLVSGNPEIQKKMEACFGNLASVYAAFEKYVRGNQTPPAGTKTPTQQPPSTPASTLIQTTDAENVAAAQAAVVAMTIPWNPVYNNNHNIITDLQAIIDAVSTGVTVTIKTTDNPQIATDGTITYPGDTAVTGNVTFTLTKGVKTVDQIILVVIFPLG